MRNIIHATVYRACRRAVSCQLSAAGLSLSSVHTPEICNDLPGNVSSDESLRSTFRRKLQKHI